MMSALAGAAALAAFSMSAQARGGNGQNGNGQNGNGQNGNGGGGHCMLRGTRILTCRGAERVEGLSIGDLVVTSRGEVKPIKWIGRQHFTQGPSSRWPDSVHPIRVARSALADNVPLADLYLSRCMPC